MTHTYFISGMTCNNCVKTVKDRLLKISGVTAVKADLEKQQAEITMQHHVDTNVLKGALRGTKYVISEQNQSLGSPALTKDENIVTFQTYLPIFLIFGYITGATLLIQFTHQAFNMKEWMQHFMAAFFLVFSFFKLLDIPAFASSYSMYDIVAKRWTGYGYIYPFIELALGISFLIPSLNILSNMLTLVVMSVSIVGVLQSVLNKRKIQCACLGAVFKLPMSSVTIIEDALMIVMSAAGLIFYAW